MTQLSLQTQTSAFARKQRCPSVSPEDELRRCPNPQSWPVATDFKVPDKQSLSEQKSMQERQAILLGSLCKYGFRSTFSFSVGTGWAGGKVPLASQRSGLQVSKHIWRQYEKVLIELAHPLEAKR